jgi:hypothetical protein
LTSQLPRKSDDLFVPLKGVLKRGFDDRVQDYLAKMDGMTADDIVNSGKVVTPKTKLRLVAPDSESQFSTTLKHQRIVEDTRNHA